MQSDILISLWSQGKNIGKIMEKETKIKEKN